MTDENSSDATIFDSSEEKDSKARKSRIQKSGGFIRSLFEKKQVEDKPLESSGESAVQPEPQTIDETERHETERRLNRRINR